MPVQDAPKQVGELWFWPSTHSTRAYKGYTIDFQENSTSMKRNLSFTCSVFVVMCYVVFTLLAVRSYPGTYSPLRNWLSDLGSSVLNPRGAAFYNIGIIATGLLTFLFFLGLSTWAMAGNKKQKIMLRLTQTFGCLGALAMVMSAVFPINMAGIHSIVSGAIYILLGTSFGLSAAALRYYPKFPKSILILGILIAVEDMIFGIVLNNYILEWVTVALFLSYILILGIATKRQAKYIE